MSNAKRIKARIEQALGVGEWGERVFWLQCDNGHFYGSFDSAREAARYGRARGMIVAGKVVMRNF